MVSQAVHRYEEQCLSLAYRLLFWKPIPQGESLVTSVFGARALSSSPRGLGGSLERLFLLRILSVKLTLLLLGRHRPQL